jgi:hypothetical protein
MRGEDMKWRRWLTQPLKLPKILISGKVRLARAFGGLLIGAILGAVTATMYGIVNDVCCAFPFALLTMPGELLLHSMSLTSRTGCGMSQPDITWLLPANAFASAVLGMLIGFIFVPKRYRRQTGLCQKCGYNLTGNTSGVCPECGEKI